AFLVFDQNFRDTYNFGSWGPGSDLPPVVISAPSLELLAERLGIDQSGLVSTVKRFNGFASAGTDQDFARGSVPWANLFTGDVEQSPNPNLGLLNAAPFYGVRLEVCGAGIPAAGLMTNQSAQVLSGSGAVVPGLFAAGTAAAPLDLGAGYQSGLSHLRGITWGFIAAATAAGRSPADLGKKSKTKQRQ